MAKNTTADVKQVQLPSGTYNSTTNDVRHLDFYGNITLGTASLPLNNLTAAGGNIPEQVTPDDFVSRFPCVNTCVTQPFITVGDGPVRIGARQGFLLLRS